MDQNKEHIGILTELLINGQEAPEQCNSFEENIKALQQELKGLKRQHAQLSRELNQHNLQNLKRQSLTNRSRACLQPGGQQRNATARELEQQSLSNQRQIRELHGEIRLLVQQNEERQGLISQEEQRIAELEGQIKLVQGLISARNGAQEGTS